MSHIICYTYIKVLNVNVLLTLILSSAFNFRKSNVAVFAAMDQFEFYRLFY